MLPMIRGRDGTPFHGEVGIMLAAKESLGLARGLALRVSSSRMRRGFAFAIFLALLAPVVMLGAVDECAHRSPHPVE